MINKRPVVGLLAVAGVLAIPSLSQATTVATAIVRADPPTSARPAQPVDLSGVCPETIVIQTDWFPESEYGAVYNLLGDDYEIDADNKIVSGSLVSEGQPTGVNIEIRAGGAAGSGDVETLMYTDDDITFAFGTTDGQILAWENTPLMSVVAPLEISPLMIMWDPETYPDVTSIADLGEQEITINAFGGQTFTDGARRRWASSPTTRSTRPTTAGRRGSSPRTARSPSRASPRPSRSCTRRSSRTGCSPVEFQLIHDAGFQTYSQTLAIRPDDLETLRPASRRSSRSCSARPSSSSPTRHAPTRRSSTSSSSTTRSGCTPPSSPSSRCRPRPSSASPATAPTR